MTTVPDRSVFISYASEDAEAARRLADELESVPGLSPWIDRDQLLGGVRWEHAIRNAIRAADAFVLLLSKSSTTKRGFVQKEVREALGVLAELPEADVFVFPVRLDDCEVHFEGLRAIQWVDLFPGWDRGIADLRRALSTHFGLADTGRTDRSVAFADDGDGAESAPVEPLRLLEFAANAAARFSGGVAVAGGKRVLFFDRLDLRATRVFDSLSANISAIAADGDSEPVVGCEDGRVYRLQTGSGSAEEILSLDDPVRHLVSMDGGRVIHACTHSQVTSWTGRDTVTHETRGPVWRLAPGLTNAAFAAAVAWPGFGGITFELDGELITEQIHADITAAAFARHPSRRVYAVGSPWGGAQLLNYELVDPRPEGEVDSSPLNATATTVDFGPPGEGFDPTHSSCTSLCFSPSGERLAAGHDGGEIAVWSTRTGRELAKAQLQGRVPALVMVADDLLLALDRDGIHAVSPRAG